MFLKLIKLKHLQRTRAGYAGLTVETVTSAPPEVSKVIPETSLIFQEHK